MNQSTLSNRHALVTGGAGFIGSHLVDRLLADHWRVTVVDNFDPFYDRALKEANIAAARGHRGYRLVELDIRDLAAIRDQLGGDYNVIFHLAAKAGVRPSIQNPVACREVALGGTQNMLEFARERRIRQFVFASSSSVYGANLDVPWREDSAVLRPISPYAASKVACELLGHVYAHLHGIRFLALRLFTVYGPRQRPDLAINKFTRLILAGRPVPVYGDGSSLRDYTYVDDIVAGILAAADYARTDFEIFNLGNGRPVSLLEMIRQLESAAGVAARLDFQPPQPGDVPATHADCSKARAALGYNPGTPLAAGLAKFLDWRAAGCGTG